MPKKLFKIGLEGQNCVQAIRDCLKTLYEALKLPPDVSRLFQNPIFKL